LFEFTKIGYTLVYVRETKMRKNKKTECAGLNKPRFFGRDMNLFTSEIGELNLT